MLLGSCWWLSVPGLTASCRRSEKREREREREREKVRVGLRGLRKKVGPDKLFFFWSPEDDAPCWFLSGDEGKKEERKTVRGGGKTPLFSCSRGSFTRCSQKTCTQVLVEQCWRCPLKKP
ncbi:MAG: hypothetical protein J3Q66DRAFT_148439, partial [Benniella sp.]